MADAPDDTSSLKALPVVSSPADDAVYFRVSLLSRAGYFSLYAGLSVSPYYGLLLRQMGLSPGAVGAVAAALPLSTLLVLPPLAHAADRHRCGVAAFLLCALFSSLLLVAVAVIHRGNSGDSGNSGGKALLAALAAGHCALRAPLASLMDERVAAALPVGRRGHWAALRAAGAVGWASGALALAAALTANAVGNSSVGSAVGNSSVGSAVGNSSVGSAVGNSSVGNSSVGSAVGNSSVGSAVGNSSVGPAAAAALFAAGAGAGGAAAFVALRPADEAAAEQQQQRPAMAYADVLRYVVRRRRLAVFLLALCAMGMGYAMIETFLFVFLDSLAAPPMVLGAAVALTVSIEIPLFHCAEAIHANATDRQLLFVSMCAWAVRVFGYSFLHNPWLVLFLEVLHGFTFGLMWLAGMHFVRKAFPRTLSYSSVGFLNATAFGAGPLIGNLVGGSMYEWLGGRWMFRSMAGVMLGLGVVFVLVDRWLERRGHSETAEEEEYVIETVT